ncbi:MAG: hypothetical protein ABUS79_11575 [Pseudomonadota bacterium]
MAKTAPRLAAAVVAVAAACLAWGAGGCSAKESGGQCSTDIQCGAGAACMMGKCLPRVSGRTLAVEIQPRTDSSSARTEIPSLNLDAGPLVLIADNTVMINGSVVEAAALATPSLAPNAHVSATLPSLLPGQTNIQFQTDLVAFKFTVGVSQRLIGKQAMLWLKPDAKTPAQPPVPFVAVLDPTMTLEFPRSADMLVVRGFLHDSLDAPEMGFVARAYFGDTVVSNAVTTDEAGQFQLLIAPTALPAGAEGKVRIEFTPSSRDEDYPRFVTELIALASSGANVKPRTFRLPAFPTAAPLRFKIEAGYPMTDTISMADFTVRFRTQIPNPPDGTAIYEREARTLDDGEVQVPLIPGTVAEPRMYEISVVPPPDSPFAVKCSPQVAVTTVGNSQQPQYMTLSLAAKVALAGTVRGHDGALAVGSSVTATPVATGSACPNTAAPGPVKATTDRTGAYRMLVDPGTYLLDIDPAAESPLPHLTESAASAFVVAPEVPTNHDVVLPAAEVVEGDLYAQDGAPLASAGIKIFEVLCHGDTCAGAGRIAPAVRAQTLTDAKGHFRALLPLP